MLDRELARAARARHGVVLQDDFDDLGASARQRTQRLSSGALVRLHGSVLAIAGAPASWQRDATAALAAIPTAVLGHTSAARLHRMERVREVDRVSLLAPLGAHHRLNGVDVRRTRLLPDSHIVEVEGFRATTRVRTIVDLAADLSDGRMQRLVEDELAGRHVGWNELAETFWQMSGRGRPGVARMRRVLERIEGSPPTESELERMYLRLLAAAGVPAPKMQVAAPWSEREPGRVDAMYVEEKAIIELDGRAFHIRAQAYERDRRRDQLAILAGYVTSRITYRQIRDDPEDVVEVSRYLSTRLHS